MQEDKTFHIKQKVIFQTKTYIARININGKQSYKQCNNFVNNVKLVLKEGQTLNIKKDISVCR